MAVLPCGCQLPHILCETGRTLQEACFARRVDVDEALRLGDLEKLAIAKRRAIKAERRYLEHIGFGVPDDEQKLGLAYERVLGLSPWPSEAMIVWRELLRLYTAAGEPVPAILRNLTVNVACAAYWRDEQVTYTLEAMNERG